MSEKQRRTARTGRKSTGTSRGRKEPRKKRAGLRLVAVVRGVLVVALLSQLPVLYLGLLPAPTSAFMVQRSMQARRDAEPNFSLRYTWVDADEIAPALALAAMASEDQRFPYHNGLDTTELKNALLDRLDGRRLRGASTISQQLAKNLFLWSGRSALRKISELYYTASLELFWSKRRILETYLNVAEFGDGIYGAEAAAKHYYQLTAASLSDAQAAWLICLLPAPKRYQLKGPSARLRKKQHWVLEQMAILRDRHYLREVAWTLD